MIEVAPALKIVPMTYPREQEVAWRESCEMLTSSGVCAYLKEILAGKVSRRRSGTRQFFGEAYVSSQIGHVDGYYGSFQWLTNEIFLTNKPFAPGPTQTFQQRYRSALHQHFPNQLEKLHSNVRRLQEASGIKAAAPDLWLIESSGLHRFIEVKLPQDAVSDNQLAGLAAIAASLSSEAGISVEVLELRPDDERRFEEFVRQAAG